MVTYTYTISVIYARKGIVAIQCSTAHVDRRTYIRLWHYGYDVQWVNMVYVTLKHVLLYVLVVCKLFRLFCHY